MELFIDENDKILIVAPHPDDESIGVGGLLLKYPHKCTVLVATDGGRAGEQNDMESMALAREQEFCHAMSMADIRKYKFLKNPDGELSNHPEYLSNIALSEYNKFFLPYAEENHPDHKSAFLYAIREIEKRNMFDIEIYQYETRGTMTDADYYLDISDVIDQKIEMINCYQTQIAIFDHAVFAESLNHFRAASSGMSSGHYEVYKRYRLNETQVTKCDESFKELARLRIENEILRRWLQFRNPSIWTEYFETKNINIVGVYGFGFIGHRLVDEIIKTGKNVLYVIDREKESSEGLRIVKPGMKYDDVDILIVTTLFGADGIVKEQESLGYLNVVTLSELLSDIAKIGVIR